jgi:hypothetical protein
MHGSLVAAVFAASISLGGLKVVAVPDVSMSCELVTKLLQPAVYSMADEAFSAVKRKKMQEDIFLSIIVVS